MQMTSLNVHIAHGQCPFDTKSNEFNSEMNSPHIDNQNHFQI